MSAGHIAWDYAKPQSQKDIAEGCAWVIYPSTTSEPLAYVIQRDDSEEIARIAAAAPELLEALILMVRTHDEPAESLLQEMKEQEWLKQARAAIARALGEQA